MFTIESAISLHVEVEARTLGEAIAKAKQAPVMSLCHQCADGKDDEWSTSGELDGGDPGNCELVDVVAGGAPLAGKKLEAACRKWRGE